MSSLATPKAIFVQVLLGLALLGSLLGLDTILAAPSSGANLDQIRNGRADSPITPGKWANGNAGSSNAHYVEGFSVPYRVVMTGFDQPAVTDICDLIGLPNGGKPVSDQKDAAPGGPLFQVGKDPLFRLCV